MNLNRNYHVIKHILRYCYEIDEFCMRYSPTVETFAADNLFRDGIAMKVLQIGELATHLTKDFKLANSQIPWHEIIGMRNFAAHNYLQFSLKTLCDTIKNDIPKLKNSVKNI